MKWSETLAEISDCERDCKIGVTHSTQLYFKTPYWYLEGCSHGRNVYKTISQRFSLCFFALVSVHRKCDENTYAADKFQMGYFNSPRIPFIHKYLSFRIFSSTFLLDNFWRFLQRAQRVSQFLTHQFIHCLERIFRWHFSLTFYCPLSRQALTENISISYLQFWLVHLRTAAQLYFCGDVGRMTKKSQP